MGYMIQNDYVVQEEADGSINIKVRSSNDVVAQVFPPQRNSVNLKPHAGQCGPQHNSFCPMTWPKQLGSIPKSASYLGEKAVSNGPGKEKNTKCGGKCDGPKQCAASAQGGSCVCAFPSPKDAQTLGLDPFFPPAVCLFVAAAFTLSASSELSGRSEATPFHDSEGIPLNCLCNATFASHACCGIEENEIVHGGKGVQLNMTGG